MVQAQPAVEDASAGVPARQDDTGDLRHRVVRALMWTALVLIMTVRLLSSRDEGLPWSAGFAAMLPYPPLVGLLTRPRRPRVRIWLLIALAVLYAVPFAICGSQWDWLPWPLAVAALCAFRGRVGWPLFGFVLLGDLVGGLWSGLGFLAALIQTCKTANDGMIIFGLFALAAMAADLHATRGELASLRLRSERRRLHGELRTVVGSRLETLCSDLDQAVAQAPNDVEAARGRLGAAVADAREALAAIRVAAGDLRGPQTSAALPVGSPFVARLVLAAVFACNGMLQICTDLNTPGLPWPWVLVTPTICAAGAVLLLMRPTNRQLVVYALIVGPAGIPGNYLFPQLQGAAELWPFFAGLVLARVRRPLSFAVIGATLAAFVSLCYYPPPVLGIDGQFAQVVSFLILAWLTYSLDRLSGLVGVLHQAREDLAEETVTRERVRVARDLHDRLSFSISAIALKGELCQRMLGSEPEAARAHLDALPGLARDAREELESMTGRPARLCFEQELAAAREMLEAAGVRMVVELDDLSLTPEADAALAVILREAMTNVLKHSRALTCSITVTMAPEGGTVHLTVENDDVPHADISRSPGCGLAECTE